MSSVTFVDDVRRVYSTGHGNKTDNADAVAIARAAIHSRHLRHVQPEATSVAMKLLWDHRNELVGARTQAACQLHRLLRELIVGGAKKQLTANQAFDLLTALKLDDPAGPMRVEIALEHIDDIAASGNRRLNKAIHIAAITQIRYDHPRKGLPPTQARRVRSRCGKVGEALVSEQYRIGDEHAPLDTAPPELAAAMSAFTAGCDFVDLVVSCDPGGPSGPDTGRHPEFRDLSDPVDHDQTRVAAGIGDIGGTLRSGVRRQARPPRARLLLRIRGRTRHARRRPRVGSPVLDKRSGIPRSGGAGPRAGQESERRTAEQHG